MLNKGSSTPSVNPPLNSAGPIINSNSDLSAVFQEYLHDARKKVLEELQQEERNCMIGHDSPEKYAKCIYAFQREKKADILNLIFRTTFLKRKMEDCMESTIYKTNKDEGTKYCIRISKELITSLLKSV